MMTKSKKTTVKLLICVLAMLMLAVVLVACNTGNTPDHYDYLVTFEYNKGNLVGNTSTQQIGVFSNSLISIRPGYSSSFAEGVVSGYYIEGWYLPVQDEDGNLIVDENGFVLLGEKWDFKTQRVNSDITLYASFKRKTQIRFVDRATGEYIEDSTGTIERVPGEKAYQPSSTAAPKMSGYTFLGKYYTTIDGQEEVKWPVTAGEEEIKIYVDFLEGDWRFVNSESEFVIAIQGNRNIYLQKDLDFGNYYETQLWGLSTYTGSINGNNHTISNITRNLVASRNDTDNFGGIFGTLGETAHIYDVNFVNINVDFKVSAAFTGVDVYVGLLASRAKEGALLENVTISGTLTYTQNNNYDIFVGVIGENKIKQEDIKECDFDFVEITVA